MKQQYAVKISKQGQLTLPAKLRHRLQVQEGSYVLISLADDNKTVKINEKPIISKHFGSLANTWTSDGDAVTPSRGLRNSMQQQKDIGF